MPAPQLRYLIYFVTSRCNLRCAHCFYLDELGPSRELSLEEIERFCQSLGSLTFLRLTGGEPFLRKDLAEVIEIFYRVTRTRRIGIITNGTRHANVQRTLEELGRLKNDLHLDIGVSIDDLGEEHDAIRRKKGVYADALRQIEELQAFQRTWPHLEVSVVVTANGKNTSRLRDIYAVIHDLGVTRISCNLVRGYVADQQLTQVDLAEYGRFLDWIDEHNRTHHKGFGAVIRRAKNHLARKAVRAIIDHRQNHQPLTRYRPFGKASAASCETSKSLAEGDGYYFLGEAAPIHCQAGRAIAVLQPEGDVNLCEVLDWPLGNLREVGFDWNAIWEGESARKARTMIDRTGCSCTHECFHTASILFGPQHYPKLASEVALEAIATTKAKIL
ncbi:MAG: radical SAM protein [Candidatus Omnitrophica bacterium]|nr:radical SAM protein [Candidatus Omnitrophota bacterium]